MLWLVSGEFRMGKQLRKPSMCWVLLFFGEKHDDFAASMKQEFARRVTTFSRAGETSRRTSVEKVTRATLEYTYA